MYAFATGCTVQGSNPGKAEIFRTRPERLWSPTSLLYTEYKVSFPPVEHPSPSNPEVKDTVELFLYSPSGSSCLIRVKFTFPWGVAEYEEKELEEEEENNMARGLKICTLQRIFLGLSNETQQISRTCSGHGKVRDHKNIQGNTKRRKI